MPRPGPRSKKQSKILQNRGSLGDSSSSDDRSVERTTPPKGSTTSRRSRRVIGSSNSRFFTPEKENNVTDYGLEFTTSVVQNPSPRRSSTLRPTSSRTEPKKSEQHTRNKSPTKNPAKQMAAKEQEAEKQNTNRGKQKQTPNKGEKQQTETRGSDDDDDEDDDEDDDDEDDDEDDDDDDEEDKENSYQRSKQTGKGQLAPIDTPKGQKQQNPEKDIAQRKSGNQLRQQRATGDELEEESGNVGNMAAGKTPVVSSVKKTNTSRRGRPKLVEPRTAKQQAQEPGTSKASRQSTDKNQQNPNPNTAAVRKPRKQLNPVQRDKRFWRAVNALQKRTDYLIPRLPFSRVVREIMMEASGEVTQITITAMEALQTSAEMYLTQKLQDAYMLTLHRGRVTLEARDLQLLNFLKAYL